MIPATWLKGDFGHIAQRLASEGTTYASASRPAGVRLRATGACFANAQALSIDRNWSYVEGLAGYADARPVHHAWNTADGTTAIDSTWRPPRIIPAGLIYVGIAFSPKDVAARIVQLHSSRDDWRCFLTSA